MMQNEQIGVIGLGKLGICFALNLERVGYDVLGVDIDEELIDSINNKELKSFEPGVEPLLGKAENLSASTELKTVVNSGAELIFIIVATPTSGEGYDHTILERVIEGILEFGHQETTRHLVVMCTTLPGFCDQLAEKVKPYNYQLSYNPEFIAQGTIVRDQQRPDQVLIGEADENAGNLIEAVYRRMCENTPAFCRMSRVSAEIAKLATNCFLTMKISFANSIGDLAISAGAEPEKILKAIGSDSRVGPKYLGYGFGYGGPCFPRDNRALSYFATSIDAQLPLGIATDKVNQDHLEFQVKQYLEKFSAGEKISFDYVSYKKDSVMLEESQQLALAVALAKAGREVVINERKSVIDELKTQYGSLFQYEERT